MGRKLKSKDVLDALAEVMAERGVPAHIRSDNGPEPERSGDSQPQAARRASEARQFIARDVQEWLREMGIATIYIEPGSPWQNGHVESFHNRLRDECLNQELFLSVAEARVVIEEWRASATGSTRTANWASKAPTTLPQARRN